MTGGGGPPTGSPFTSGLGFLNSNPFQTQQPGQSLTGFLSGLPANGLPPANTLPQTQYTPAGAGLNLSPSDESQFFAKFTNPQDGTTTGVPFTGNTLANWQQTNGSAGGDFSPDNPGQDIINNLMSQLAGMGSGPSIQDLTNQANQQASLKYDPLIQQLQQNLGTAKANEGTASKQVGDLYNSLGKALAAQMPVITNQFNQQEDQSRQNYATLQNQIQSNYQNAQNAQAAELQKLGIQAALPQSTQQLQSDQQYLTNQAATNGQALNDAMRTMGQGQADFMQRASAIAPTEGANIQADLAQQLLQLENNINQQIAGYKGQEGAAAQSILAQLQNQANGNLGKQQTNLIDQTMKLAQLEKLTNPGIFGVAPKAPSATKYKGVSAIPQYFQDNASLNDPGALENIFQTFATSPQYAQLSGPGGAGSPTLETAWPLLQQDAQQMIPGIPASALQELYNALAIKMGKFQ
jgi:hypothetical protein